MIGHAYSNSRPPPQRPFWSIDPFFVNLRHGIRAAVRLSLETPRRTFYHPSPVNSQIKYPEIMVSDVSGAKSLYTDVLE